MSVTTSDSPLTGHLTGKTHRYPLRVYYEDTDAGGIVYHASYLRFAERARTEMLRCLSLPHSALIAEHGVMLAVRSLSIDYLSPARLDDALIVSSRILHIGGASIKMSQLVALLQSDGTEQPCGRILLRLACIDGNGRPARLPDRFVGPAMDLIEKEVD